MQRPPPLPTLSGEHHGPKRPSRDDLPVAPPSRGRRTPAARCGDAIDSGTNTESDTDTDTDTDTHLEQPLAPRHADRLPPLHITPHPTVPGELLQTVEAGYPDADRALVHRVCRSKLGAIVGHFFPHPDTPPMGSICASRALLFALRGCHQDITDPLLRTCLAGFGAALEQAGILGAWLESKPPSADAGFVAQWLLPRLRSGEPVLVDAGFESPDESHAVALYFYPCSGQQTLCVVADRVFDSPYHPADRPGHPVPLIYCLDTEALTTAPGVAALCDILALQRAEPAHTLDGFYAAVTALVGACHGTTAVGWQPDGSVRYAYRIAGQAEQKAGTCTMHSLFTVLHFALHAAFGTLALDADLQRRATVTAYYKQIKNRCRGIALAQVCAAQTQARRQGSAEASALHAALLRTQEYLRCRVDTKPLLREHLRRLDAALQLG